MNIDVTNRRCTANTRSHSCSVMAVKDLSRRIPAFATRTWTPPNFSIAVLTIVSPSSAEQTTAAAFPPAIMEQNQDPAKCLSNEGRGPLTTSSTTARAPFSLTSLTTTLAPSFPYICAYARPRPAPAPVIITVWPSKRTSGVDCTLAGCLEAFASLPYKL